MHSIHAVNRFLSKLSVVLVSYLLLIQSAYAAITVSDMIENIAAAIPPLMQFVTALAYVLGFYFVFNGILLLRKYGEQRTQMSSEAHLKGPLISLAVGSALIYLPSSVTTGMATFWTEPAPYAYVTTQTDPWSQFYMACFVIIQFIGVIAFVRGLVILSHLGGHAQPGTFGKGMAHIIGGVMCIDLYDFLQTIFATLGIEWTF